MIIQAGRFSVFIATFFLVGCSHVTRLTIDAPGTTILSMDAKQRVILVTDKGGPLTKDEKGNYLPLRRVVCAEPSPDVFAALAAYGGISVGQRDMVNSGSADAGFAQTVATIARRTATTQLLRDGLYRACEAYMNGVIGHTDYRQIIMAYDEILITLVSLEGLGRPMIDMGHTIGEQKPQALKDSNQSAGGKDGTDSATNGTSNANPTALTTNPASSNSPASAGQTTAASHGKSDSKGSESKGSTAALPESGSLESYAAENIHNIVRDYYCFQLALKKMFYARQPKTQGPNEENSSEDQYGDMSGVALSYMCGNKSAEPDKQNQNKAKTPD